MRASAIMSAYNATWCIRRALDSLLAQTLPPHEIIVCDDGSTDGTPDLVERTYGERVTVLRLPHVNASSARVTGIAHARGDWIAFVDADDVWLPEKLERQAAFLERRPEVRWIGTDGELFSDHGVVRDSWLSDYFDQVDTVAGDLLPPLVRRCFPLMSSMLVEREAYDSVGGMDATITYSHDYDLWLRLAARYPGAMLSDRLVRYYTGPANLSRRYEARYRDDLKLMRRVARGRLTADPALRAAAAERAASIEFDLGVLCLRSGRTREGRLRLWRATRLGPPRRRLMALGGALLPKRALPLLMRSEWIKRRVQSAREPAMVLGAAGERSR